RRLVVTRWDRKPVRIWDMSTWQELPNLDDSQGVSYDGLGFSTDSRLIVAGDRDGHALVWSADGGKPLYVFSAPANWKTGDRTTATLSADGSKLAVGYSSGQVRVYQLPSKRLFATWAAQVKPRSVTITPIFCRPDERSLAISLNDAGRVSTHM